MKGTTGRSSCHLNSLFPRMHFAYCFAMFCPGADQASARITLSIKKLYSANPVTFALVNLELVKGPSQPPGINVLCGMAV